MDRPSPNSRRPVLMDEYTTATNKSPETDSCYSLHHNSGHFSCASNNEVRKRYLHRLGIHAGPSNKSAQEYESSSSGAKNSVSISYSAPEKGFKMSHSTSRSSSFHDNHTSLSLGTQHHRDKMLLRRSVQYATKLKVDCADTEISDCKFSYKSLREEDNQPSTKFELSSAWMSLLSKDTASTTSASSEPLDGAYDLFSLPSESSIAASRCDSARSLDNTVALDRLPSRDELTIPSMPKQRKVSFDSTCTICTIPNRLTYSDRTRTRLWSSMESIYVNAIRNEKEYAYDGNDWRTAREESDFFPWSSSSSQPEELVHPVHFGSWLTPPQPVQQQARVTTTTESSVLSSPGTQKVTSNANTRPGDNLDFAEEMFEME